MLSKTPLYGLRYFVTSIASQLLICTSVHQRSRVLTALEQTHYTPHAEPLKKTM